MRACSSWLGHRFVAHPQGYHFCRRCGASDQVQRTASSRDQLLATFRVPAYYLPDPSGPETPPSTQPPAAGRSNSAEKPGAQEASPPAGGGGPEQRAEPKKPGKKPKKAKAKADVLDPDLVRQRVQKWLDTLGCSASTAIDSRGMNLGASAPTIDALLAGTSNPYQSTLRKISQALDQLALEDETPGGEVGPRLPPIEEPPAAAVDESKVEVLPGVQTKHTTNTIPNWKPPPRCGKTP